MLQAKRYPYKNLEECPQDKQTEFLWYLTRRAIRGENTTKEGIIWLKAVGELPKN